MSFGTGIVKEKSIKGDYAEEIVENFFLSQGWEIYTPSGTKAHLYDGNAVKYENGEYKKFYYDVKSKAARNLFPDTGVDLKHYKHYQEIAKEFGTFLIIFVDEELGKVYYQNLKSYLSDEQNYKIHVDEFGIQYPKIENNKNNNEKYIYFSLETMNKLKSLSQTEIDKLKDLSTTTEKNYKFKPIDWDPKNYLK